MEKKTELITNRDGSIFHLNLLPDDISHKIIIVGDPGRVDMLSQLFENIRVKKENREFRTVTGTFEGAEITLISSGIGTDNIDILVNELDALVNIDLKTGEIREEQESLTLVRLGTSGGLREDIPAGSCVLTETAIGFDGLIHFYEGHDWILDTTLASVQNILNGLIPSPFHMLLMPIKRWLRCSRSGIITLSMDSQFQRRDFMLRNAGI